MLGKILSIAILVFIGITFPIFYLGALIIWILTYHLDSHLRFLHYYTCFWASTYTWVMPTWRIKIEGREKCRKGVTYVIVSNHQSQLDILVNFRLFLFYKIVSKSEMFRVPFMGWNMYLNRYIKLVRGNKDGVRKMMEDCEKTLAEGNSVFIYPEGTRSLDGEIKDFKPGAFILAHKAKAPILPIVLTNTGKALPKWKMNTSGIHRIKERVLDEIPYAEFAHLSVEETANHVRRIMVAELVRLNEEAE
ncbi:MAG: 1-acyl-sn-glycerol-3-phosphate acyltransferase [Deltaproteobacteria bacterium HGW-Deltaproteobacteria-10]|nr:MAG: 1-acyl-sn-glycerol-3-phosphate acyltransferase [Deltaproteobacteria bacterium HGW-Deltaproteobacteria-10]